VCWLRREITGQALIDLQRALSLKESAAVWIFSGAALLASTAKKKLLPYRLFGGCEKVMEEAKEQSQIKVSQTFKTICNRCLYPGYSWCRSIYP
jgi:hypothetical protein